MIKSDALKTDKLTVGLRDLALHYSEEELDAMQEYRRIRNNKLDEPLPLVLVNVRTTEKMRDQIQKASTHILGRVDKELAEDGHKRVDMRGRRDQGRNMILNALSELMYHYAEGDLDPEKYPHEELVDQFFEEVFIPYLKERRLSRDY